MEMFDVCVQKAEQKKKQLDKLRPFPPALVKNLEEWFKIDYTYNSNAIEGNTLSPSETALVVEKGLTIAGKTLTEHLEAINHAYAIDYLKELVTAKSNIDNTVIKDIHSLILKKIDDEHAGKWRTIGVKISGSDVQLADPVHIQELMEDFEQWLLSNEDHPIKKAADAHLKLVTIHPFVDGNGRTARLIMNLILMQHGYPPAIIQNKDRMYYITALEKAQKENDPANFYQVVCAALERSMDMWLDVVSKTIR